MTPRDAGRGPAPKIKTPRSAKPGKPGSDRFVVASNRKARHDYEVLEVLETGIALLGTEVKSLRAAKVVLKDAYGKVEGGELWLVGVHVAPYDQADGFGGHEPERTRKLLAHRDEIAELAERTKREALTLVPLSIYFREGRAKVELALARGRQAHDKRHAIAERDARRETDRAVAAQRRKPGGGGRER